jgi:hypothetical protein
MHLGHKNNRKLITGRTGAGKSSFTDYFLRKEAKFDICFVCDIKDEWAHRLGVVPTTDFSKITGREKFVVFNPLNDPAPEEAFEDFCLFVFTFCDLAGKHVLVVFEELQEFVNHRTMPDNFRACLVRGRKHRLDMLMLSTQPNMIHNSIRSNISEVISFGQADENSTKYSRHLGIEGVQDLQDCVFYRKAIGKAPEKYEIRFTKKGIDIVSLSDTD